MALSSILIWVVNKNRVQESLVKRTVQNYFAKSGTATLRG